MIDFGYAFQVNGVADVMLDEFKGLMAEQVMDILGVAGRHIIQANDFIARFEQGVAEVRPDKARAAGDEDGFFLRVGHGTGLSPNYPQSGDRPEF